MAKYKFSVVACARWEEKYIEEWINYYASIGYNHIYLYCNDDIPDSLQKVCEPYLVGENPFVTFVHYGIRGFQHQMYLHFISNFSNETEWVSFFDIDEFLYLPKANNISEFVASYGDVDCILFNWLVFGPGDYETAPPGSVLENYNRRERDINAFTKFVGRSSILKDENLYNASGVGFWHSPVGRVSKKITAVNVLGSPVTPEMYPFVPKGPKVQQQIIETATVHHYIMKSKDYIRHRIERGLDGTFSKQKETWYSENPNRKADIDRIIASFNAVEDNSLVNYWSNLRSKSYTSMPLKFAGPLLSQNKPCQQSSISEWSVGDSVEEDAGRAVNGVFTGGSAFHTGREVNPWWMVDLEAEHDISVVCIYNRCDSSGCIGRVRNIKIDVSFNGDEFYEVYRKDDGKSLGGIISQPLAVPLHCRARFIKITLLAHDYFHLDQVEVFGEV